MREGQCRRIGANTEESGLPERQNPRVTPENIYGQGGGGIEERTHQDVDRVGVKQEWARADDGKRDKR